MGKANPVSVTLASKRMISSKLAALNLERQASLLPETRPFPVATYNSRLAILQSGHMELVFELAPLKGR